MTEEEKRETAPAPGDAPDEPGEDAPTAPDETPAQDEAPDAPEQRAPVDGEACGTSEDDCILEAQDLKVYFPIHAGLLLRKVGDVKAVDGVSFRIRRGETLGLVGESGCGKTTVGKAIIALAEATDGHIYYSRGPGHRVDLPTLTRKEMRPYRADIQMVFQDPYSSLNPRWSVGDIIAEPLLIHNRKLSAQERDERVAWLLEKVGLRGEQAQRYPHEFSGGQRQRVGVARALSTNPHFIIADEPVSALDVSIQAQVINLLQDLQEEFDLTYLFIAHDLSVVVHISDRIAVMYLGNIVELGDSQTVFESPVHPYSKALLSAVPLPDPRKERKERIMLKGDVPSPLAKPSGCGFRTRCHMARDECAELTPEMREVMPSHFVACPFV